MVVPGLTASPQFNGRTGLVQGPAPRPERLAVLLDGDTTPRPSARPTSARPTGFNYCGDFYLLFPAPHPFVSPRAAIPASIRIKDTRKSNRLPHPVALLAPLHMDNL